MQCHMANVKNIGATTIMEDVDITATNQVTAVEEYAVHKKKIIGADAVMTETTIILHITVGHTECVLIRSKTAGPHRMASKRT